MKGLLIGEKVKIIQMSSQEDRKGKTTEGQVVSIFDEFILVRHKNYLESYLKKNFLVKKRNMKLFIKRDKQWIEVDKHLLKYEKFDFTEVEE